jgi:hypothetical protein
MTARDHAMENSSLPSGFEALEPFVADWVLPDSIARMTKRQASSIEDIRRFYDAILPLADTALAHLRDFQLGELPPREERLLKLMLSLAEVGPAVEWFGDPMVYDGFDVHKVRYTRILPDTAAQA